MDKMIHADEFRLRVLLTNQCPKKCDFCLNDFQPKEPELYANPFELCDCIRAYGSFMKYKGQKSIITFSGGEPGIYPFLDVVLPNAKFHCDEVKLVTNGLALTEKYYPYVDKWHVGVTEKIQMPTEPNVLVQYVVTDKTTFSELSGIVTYYQSQNVPVKLFADFHSKNKEKIYEMIYKVPDVQTRFTGKQINRGKACFNCTADCVTLKALWYFPDNTSSTCPQNLKEKFDDDSWDETVEKAYELHKM